MMHNNKSQTGFGVIAIMAVIVVVVSVGFVGYRVLGTFQDKDSGVARETSRGTNDDTVTQDALPAQQPFSLLDVRVKPEASYEVSIEGGTKVHGTISQINEDYIRLSPAYFLQDSGSAVSLRSVLLHGPEPIMYIRRSFVTGLAASELLEPTHKDISDAFPATTIGEYIKPEVLQAVTFRDGNIVFGRLSGLGDDGDRLFSGAVFVLNHQSGGDISLRLAITDEYRDYDELDVIFWENLTPDSEVAMAISYYENENSNR
jgi:hypothetical protein